MLLIMPRPPTLQVINWADVFSAGKPWSEWIGEGESREKREEMDRARRKLSLQTYETRLVTNLERNVHVVAIAEDWCGDVIRHVPVIQRLADLSEHLRIRYIARADRPDIFVRYLTNGGEAIPRFIFLNHEFVECGNWGPMPLFCCELIARGKACGDVASARRKIGVIYESNLDRSHAVRELLALSRLSASDAFE